ncbi:MAG TPA: hypothetical protein VN980_08300 [Alphaproteobacteria bacterium]|nr:hypothetical protein [Alphaproteobacteria bacterium]
MRPLLTLAAVAALTITLGCAQGDPARLRSEAQPPPEAMHNPDSTYRPEMIPYAAAEMQNVIAGCRNKRLSGELKSFAESANCSNSMIVLAYGWLNYPYMDLVRSIAASRLAVSERVDEGKLSETEAQTLMAELGKEVNAEVLRRQSLALVAQSRPARVSDGSAQQASAALVATPGSRENPIRHGIAALTSDHLLEHSIQISQASTSEARDR